MNWGALITTYPVFGSLIVLINIYQIVVIIRIILSWVNPDPYNPLVRFICSITDPFLDFFRRILPIRIGFMDLSPLIAFGALYVLEWIAKFLLSTFKI
jgi:YggT family protein